MVRRLLCLLLVEPQIREKKIDLSGTSESFEDISLELVVKTAREMEYAGSRYKNLEQALGPGIVFILGKDIPETHWTKLLPKSGEKFDGVVNHMKNTSYPIPSASLRKLRHAVIQQKVLELMSLHDLQQQHVVSQNNLQPFSPTNLAEIHYQQYSYPANSADLSTEGCASAFGMPLLAGGGANGYYYNGREDFLCNSRMEFRFYNDS